MANLYAQFCSNLNVFRSEGKYSDVSIQIDDRIYRCHRVVLAAASSYFDAMFAGNYAEAHSNKRPVILQNIEVAAFERVLQFLYTQCVPEITIGNFEELLFASDYFGISEIEDACVSFIEENVSTIDNGLVLALYFFGHALNIGSLVTVLSRYIVENLHVFLRIDKFLKIAPDIFLELLVWRQCYLSDFERLFINEDSALEAIIQWTFNSLHREERRQHFLELIDMIDMDQISTDYGEFCLRQYNLNIHYAVEPQLNSIDLLSQKNHADNAACPVSFENSLTLHVYVLDWYQKSIKIISANKYRPDWFVSCQKRCNNYGYLTMESVTLNCPDRLYCLKVNCVGKVMQQIFCAYSSIDASLVDSVRLLKTLPQELSSFDLTVAGNKVYLYDSCISNCRKPIVDETRAASLGFTSEEICRGIYRYDCELDQWFPVPEMKLQTRGACMTTAFDMVYLIGGEDFNLGCRSVGIGYVQAYDYRVSGWIELPKTHKLYNGRARACSSPDGKIYVSDGFNIEVFDPVAGRWELVYDADDGEPNKRRFYVNKMVFYENLLWFDGITVGNFTATFLKANWNLSAFNTVVQEWSSFESLNRSTIKRSTPPHPFSPPPLVRNLVVFKPPANYLHL